MPKFWEHTGIPPTCSCKRYSEHKRLYKITHLMYRMPLGLSELEQHAYYDKVCKEVDLMHIDKGTISPGQTINYFNKLDKALLVYESLNWWQRLWASDLLPNPPKRSSDIIDKPDFNRSFVNSKALQNFYKSKRS
jgi:hypothetical protein